jgi:hypothetical protein
MHIMCLSMERIKFCNLHKLDSQANDTKLEVKALLTRVDAFCCIDPDVSTSKLDNSSLVL